MYLIRWVPILFCLSFHMGSDKKICTGSLSRVSHRWLTRYKRKFAVNHWRGIQRINIMSVSNISIQIWRPIKRKSKEIVIVFFMLCNSDFCSFIDSKQSKQTNLQIQNILYTNPKNTRSNKSEITREAYKMRSVYTKWRSTKWSN